MKKVYKISFLLVVILIITIGSVWVYRSVIMRKILAETISDRSGGRMILSLSEIDYNPFEKSLKVVKLNLKVSPSDSIKQKQTNLSQLSFDSVTVSGFDLWALITERRIKATEVLTDRPEIVFLHTENQKNNKLSLSKHLQSLRENSGGFSVLPIDIDLLKVEYGNVTFESDSTKKELGSADFMVELHDFDTSVDSLEFDSHSFLYARRLIIDISNFVKPLKNERELNINNIRFDSKYDQLNVSDFSLSRGGGGAVDSIFIDNVEIVGLTISDIERENDLNIQSILVNGGFLGVLLTENNSSSKKEKTRETLEQIFPLIKKIDIDTIMFANINCTLFNNDYKKTALAKGLDFQFVGLSIDTSMYFDNLFPNFDLFELDLKYFSFDSAQNIQFQNISYSTNSLQLKMSNVLSRDRVGDIDFKSDRVLVEGVDLRLLLDKKINRLELILTNPDLSVNISSEYFDKSKKKKQSSLTELLKLDKIIVDNADIALYNNEGLRAGIKNLDISFGISETDVSKIGLANLNWVSENIDFSNEKENLSFSSVESSYQNNYLNLKGFNLNLLRKGNNPQIINFGFLDIGISDLEIVELIEFKRFSARKILLTNPVLDISLSLNDNLKEMKSVDSLFIELPIDIKLGELVLKDGDLKIININEETSFATTFNLFANEIDFPKHISFNEIKEIDLRLKLDNSIFETQSISAIVESFAFNTNDSCVHLHNLNLDIDSLGIKNMTLSSDKFQIDNISLLHLDYFGLLKTQSFVFDKLMISEPVIDLHSFSTENLNNTENSKKPKNSILSKTDFNEIELNDLSFNYKLVSNGTSKKISVGDLDILWKPQEDSCNFLTELELNISDLELLNSKNQSKIAVGHIFTSQLNNDLEFSNLIIDKALTEQDNGFFARVPFISLKNIVHNSQQPFRIEIDELSSDTLFLDFSHKESRQQQLSFSGRVEALEEYSDLVKRFNIKKSSFRNLALSINNISDSLHKNFAISEMDIYVTDVGFSSSDSSMLHLSNIKLDLNGRKYITADSLYEISSGDISYDFSNSSMSIDSFRLKPMYASEEFFKKAVFQTTMLDVWGKKIMLSGIDFQRAISQKEFMVSSIDLDGFKLIAYRDKKYPFIHGIEKPFPSEAIRNLKTKFYVDTLRLNNSYILFGEYVSGSVIPGEIFFTDVNMLARELSNMPEEMTFPPIIKVGFGSKVMGNTKLTANVEFPLNTNGFIYSGKTEEIDFRDFNSMTQNLFGVSITKGMGNLDIIGVNAGDSIATGSMIFNYKRLRVRLYDREKAQLNKGIAAPFFSFLVNDLLVKSNNPRFLGKTRTGLVYIEPNKEKFFINYIWKSILSGMMSTMWHNSKEQRKEKQRIKQNDE